MIINQPDSHKDNIAPKDISNRFFFSLFLIILLFSISFIYIYKKNIASINKRNIEQTKNRIIQAKKDYLKTAIDRTFIEIQLLEKIPLDKTNSTPEKLKEHAKTIIRNTILKDSGYIFVNEIINYEGGDKYAIRAVHSNLPDTEGNYLSTNTQDIKGNTPYLTELEGVKAKGELFFTYWFKKFGQEKISHKLTYVKLYKKYNWIIGTGVYLDDVDDYISNEIIKNKLVKDQQNRILVILVIITLALAIITAIFYKERIHKILKFYIDQVKDRELALKKINESLEKTIKIRSEQLNQSEKSYRAIFHNNQSIMMLIDPNNGNIVDANQAALNFYNYSLEEFTSIKISDINILPPKKVKQAMEISKSQSNYFLFKHRLSSGEIKDVEVYSEHMIINNNELLFSIVHDISELRKTQQELIIAKKRAEESDKLKTAFLANMSHEIRTPLNSILGFSDLIINPHNTLEQNSRFSNIINTSGLQLMRIIDDIIDISHIESKQLKVSLSPISTNKTLEKIADTFKNTVLNSKNKVVDFKLQIPNTKKDFIINTDEVRFTQICNNLLRNAWKFTNEGYIEIGYIHIKNNSKEHLKFYVKDTGCGIAENKFDLIFDRFSQVAYDEYREGNGLGLSITEGLVKLLGGEMELESTLGKGSCFYFTIPLNFPSIEQIMQN